MRTRYKVSFALTANPSVKDVAAKCVEWATTRFGRERVDLPLDRDVDLMDLGKGITVQTMAITDAGRDSFSLRFAHPDGEEENVRWIVELAVTGGAGLETIFSCSISIESALSVVIPMRRQASRPRIVAQVLKLWGGMRGLPLMAVPVEVGADDAAGIAAMLTSEKRRRPVVMISARNKDDQPVVDPDLLADWLAGLAHVLVARDRFVSMRLNNHIPKHLNCWDGAIRVYWPGFRITDEGYRHRLWAPGDIAIAEQRVFGFREALLGWLSEASAYGTEPDEVSWALMESRRRRLALDAMREGGDYRALLELADQESKERAQEVAELRAQLADLGEKLTASEQRESSWKQAYFDLTKTAAATPVEAADVPIVTVAQAVERAEVAFGDRIVFALNGRSEVKKSEFEAPSEVYAALEFLATRFYDAHTGEGAHDDFDTQVRSACGWWYRGSQSDVTMKKYREWYSAKVDGRVVWLPKHIGRGSSKDPRRTIRIAFEWDKETHRVVVGFIGQHQETNAT